MKTTTASENETQHDTYWAFISYRHSDNKQQDREWASWIHQEIERYEIPAELVGTENDRGDIIPDKIYPVFRDEESLPADADLKNSISDALDRSQFLVALCSPGAVESKYVAQEIEHFQSSSKAERIIAGIISGEPGDEKNECFPAPLRNLKSSDGKLIEPIAADFRLTDGSQGYTSAEAYKKHLLNSNTPKKLANKKAESYDERLQLMKLKIIAGILGKPLEILRDRDKAYQLAKAKKRQRTLTTVIATVSLLALAAIAASIFALNQKQLAETQKNIAVENETIAISQREKLKQEKLTASRILSLKHYSSGKENFSKTCKDSANIEFLRAVDLNPELTIAIDHLGFNDSSSPALIACIKTSSQLDQRNLKAISTYKNHSLKPEEIHTSSSNWVLPAHPEIPKLKTSWSDFKPTGRPAVSYDEKLMALVGNKNDHNNQLSIQFYKLPELEHISEIYVSNSINKYNRPIEPLSISWRKNGAEIILTFIDPEDQTTRVDIYDVSKLCLVASSRFRNITINSQHYDKFVIGTLNNSNVEFRPYYLNPIKIRPSIEHPMRSKAPLTFYEKYGLFNIPIGQWAEGITTFEVNKSLSAIEFTSLAHGHKLQIDDFSGSVKINNKKINYEFFHPVTHTSASSLTPCGVHWTPKGKYIAVCEKPITGFACNTRFYDFETKSPAFGGLFFSGLYAPLECENTLTTTNNHYLPTCTTFEQAHFSKLVLLNRKLNPWDITPTGEHIFRHDYIPLSIIEFHATLNQLEFLWEQFFKESYREVRSHNSFIINNKSDIRNLHSSNDNTNSNSKLIIIKEEITLLAFARKHKTTIQKLNYLNNFNLKKSTILGIGSYLEVPLVPK